LSEYADMYGLSMVLLIQTSISPGTIDIYTT